MTEETFCYILISQEPHFLKTAPPLPTMELNDNRLKDECW